MCGQNSLYRVFLYKNETNKVCKLKFICNHCFNTAQVKLIKLQKCYENEVLPHSLFSLLKREEIRKSGKGYKKTLEKEHGGTALREYYITEDVGWYADRKEWDKLKSFGMVHKTLRKGEKTEEEYRYYICSIGEDAEEFERAARGHWGVENGLHWHFFIISHQHSWVLNWNNSL